MYTKEYYSAMKRKKCGSVELRWNNLEPIIQSEATPKEINKCRILRHIYIYIYMEYRKMVLKSLFTGQE